MNTDMISYDQNGSFNPGLFHRALMVARELYNAGLWDGCRHIIIVDPDGLCRTLAMWGLSATALRAGTDYRIQ